MAVSLRRALVAAALLVIAMAQAAADGNLAACLALRERACVVEAAAAGALAQLGALDRIAGLAAIARLLALDDEQNDARDLLAWADVIAAAVGDPDMQDDAWVLLAAGHAEAGDFAGALAIATQVRDEGRRAFARSNVAIAAAEAGEIALVLELLPEANDQLGDALKEELAETFADAGDWTRLFEIAQTLVFWNPDMARWIPGEFVAHDRFVDAIRLFELIPPSPVLKDFGARGFVDGWVARGDLATARQMALAIRTLFHSDSALVDVAKAYARRGDDATAEAVIAQISDGETRGDALVAFAAATAERGNVAGALGIAQRAATDPPPSRSPNTAKRLPRLIYDEIARAQARAGDVGGAVVTALRIDDRGDREMTLVAIAKQRIDSGDRAGGLVALEEFLRTASLQPVNLAVVRDAVRELARAGDAARAAVLAQALPQPGDRALTLARAAVASADRPEAFAALVHAVSTAVEKIDAPNQRVSANAALAVLRARVGDSAAAAAMIDGFDADTRAKALLAIAFPAHQPLP